MSINGILHCKDNKNEKTSCLSLCTGWDPRSARTSCKSCNFKCIMLTIEFNGKKRRYGSS